MRNQADPSSPPHPGAVFRERVLPSLGVSVSRAASEMGIARQTLHRILAAQAALTPDMALRIAQFSGTRAETWLALQQRHDLWRVRQDLGPLLGTIPVHALPRAFRFAAETRHAG